MKEKFFVFVFILMGVFLGIAPITTYADCDVVIGTNTTPEGGIGLTSYNSLQKSQSFTAACTGSVSSVDFFSATYSSPSDGTTLSVSDSLGGTDSTSPSHSLSEYADQGGGVCTSLDFTFSSPFDVTFGNTYYVTIMRTGSYSGSDWFYWCGTGGSMYSNGTMYTLHDDNVTWTDDSADTSMTIHITTPSLPSELSTSTPTIYNGTIHEETPLDILWAILFAMFFYFCLQVVGLFRPRRRGRGISKA